MGLCRVGQWWRDLGWKGSWRSPGCSQVFPHTTIPFSFPKTIFPDCVIWSDGCCCAFWRQANLICVAHGRHAPSCLGCPVCQQWTPSYFGCLVIGEIICWKQLLSSIAEPTAHSLRGALLRARARWPVMTPDPKYTASLLLANCATGNPLPGPVNLSAPRWVGREVEDLNGKRMWVAVLYADWVHGGN